MDSVKFVNLYSVPRVLICKVEMTAPYSQSVRSSKLTNVTLKITLGT